MRHLYLELLLSDHNSFCTPPCRDACPTHIKIPQFLDYIAHKDYKNGVRKLREDLPFPAVLGRVCPRPCEGPCRRQLVEHPITICQLHRFMADQTIDEEQTGELLLPVEPKADTGKKHRHRGRRARRPRRRLLRPARGPLGQDLRGPAQAGRHAALRHPELPPAARPPGQGDQRALAHGRRAAVRTAVSASTSSSRSSPPSTTPCSSRSGAFNSNGMGVPGEDADGVVTAVDFLGELELTGEVHVGQKVVVIGGGFTAMDACRTSRRARARPRSPASTAARARRCRRTRPRSTRPRRRASSSSCLCAPLRVITGADSKVTGIEMQRMELGEPDASGRRRPVPVEGSEFVVECDQVIAAIGQFPKLDGTSEEQGVKRTKWRTIQVDRLDLPDRRTRACSPAATPCSARRPSSRRSPRARRPPGAWTPTCAATTWPQVSQSLAELKATPFFDVAERPDRPRPAHRAHGRDPAGLHRHDDRRHASQPAGRDAQAGAATSARPTSSRSSSASARTRPSRGAELLPAVLLPGQRQVRPAAVRHRVRGLQEPLPRRRRPRLPGRLPPRLHHARAQPLHQLRPLRARLPHGGRVELLRQHGPRLRHHRQHRGQHAAAAGRLRELRQVRRDVPHGLHRDQPAHPRQLRPRREPLHLLRRVRRGLPLRCARAARLLRARRLQPHDDGARVALRPRVAPGRDAA